MKSITTTRSEAAVERETNSATIGWITMLGYLALCGILYGMN